MSCCLSSIIKSEDPASYAKLANEGVLLGYPVKIAGIDKRPDNSIAYHASIKHFDNEKDHPHSIHEVAQHLPLNPPDAKNTQIEPGQFKDRFGKDVYVLKLKGNSADKLKEHNSKFSHMGYPSKFVWEPHISVDQNTWQNVKNSGAKTAHEAGIEFGNAELKRGPQILKTYHHEPDTTEPRVPDEGDMTAKLDITKSEKSDPIPAPSKDTYRELSLHHGTKSDKPFEHFDMKHHASGFYPGVYTSSDSAEAKQHGHAIKVGFKGHLFEIKNAKHADELHQHAGGGGSGHKLVRKLKEKGYHGIKRGSEHIIFDSKDAKIEKSEEVLGEKPLMKPYVSEAQRRWAHTPTGKKALGGEAGVHEWDEATKGKKLPEKVGKSCEIHKADVSKNPRPPTSWIKSNKKMDVGKMFMHSNGQNMRVLRAHYATEPSQKHTYLVRQHGFGVGVEKSEQEIKQLIKNDHLLHSQYGKALALSGETFQKYIDDTKELRVRFSKKER